MPPPIPTRSGKRQPLHKRVKKDILQMIRRRGLAEGDRIPHIRELARQYNVSYVTATKAVSALVEAQVLESRVGDGTYVRQGALSGAGKQVKVGRYTIAAVLRDVYSLDLFNLGATIRTMGGFCQQQGLTMQMLMVHEDHTPAGIETLIQNIAAQRVDGLVIASRVDPRLILRLQEEGIVFVWVGDELTHHQTYSVLGSRVGGVLDGLRTLRELGQQRVGVMHEPFLPHITEAAHIDARLRGEAFDPRCDVTITNDRDAARSATDQLLDQGCDALLCSHEQTTAWSQQRAMELGYDIPGQLLYATFAAPASNFPMPAPFVSLCAPMEQMAQEACRLLLELLEGHTQPNYQAIFDTHVLVPNSIRNRKVKPPMRR